MIVALLALFVALSGTAVAAGVVPLAKRALVADNAKKLNGIPLAQVIAKAQPNLYAALGSWALGPGGNNVFSVQCPLPNSHAISGGFINNTRPLAPIVVSVGAIPSGAGLGATWSETLLNQDASLSAGGSGTLWAVCMQLQR
jgi:hypothetical protein